MQRTMQHIILLFICALLAACANEIGHTPAGDGPEPLPEGEVDASPAATGEHQQADHAAAQSPQREESPQREDSLQRLDIYQHAKHAQLASVPSPGYHWPPHPVPPVDRENYAHFDDNGVQTVVTNPVSTFALDVDTAAYANVRRLLRLGQLPPMDAVRIEELVNYFGYDYPQPERDLPFGIHTEIGPSPWAADRHLLHVGINAQALADSADMPPANLTFLVDVSGSMRSPDKIGLLKRALKMLVGQLRAQDHVAIVVYAGAAGEVLAPTPGSEKIQINQAIERLEAGGSTNGGAGIQLAYSLARQQFKADGINRVILATDGDFNVGTTELSALEQMVERQRRSGVALTVLGFGQGNYNDALMQKIAQIGNGNAAYIDSVHEARKVLVEELGATLEIVAKDVKVQIEFNPAAVESYRLIGYETRHLEREDFNNDKVDAGDVGRGHTVTALYELTLVGSGNPSVDPLRYGTDQRAETQVQNPDELAFLKLRYKSPTATKSQLITRPVVRASVIDRLDATSDDFRFSAAVAWFGQILRHSIALEVDDPQALVELANLARGADRHGYRSEFVTLARTVASLVEDPAYAATGG